MKVSKLIFALGLLTAASLPGIAVAHEHKAAGYEHGRHMQHAPMKRMLAGLELTDSQREQIKQLMQQHRSEQKATRAGNTERQQMRDLLAADTFDEVAARQLIAKQQQQAADKRLAAMKLQHQVLQLLTDEQRQQLNEKRQKWQQKKQQRSNS
ncbi:Spy/CpxP family protein refolding chaperone [Rheinheimera sp.]|uniref:Spy/CpxP family protein refolding chaperone n=1 Tax=Rheinheimera sp. TaxID=1869214 RepID=UPI002734EF76|nr:Spy/CpxP family protein refolding chaperone [Rheinheimera sp.]MDP2714913.1 Spy/CpxP family protein refolding chaperone [Rheinheimera sp.]